MLPGREVHFQNPPPPFLQKKNNNQTNSPLPIKVQSASIMIIMKFGDIQDPLTWMYTVNDV